MKRVCSSPTSTAIVSSLSLFSMADASVVSDSLKRSDLLEAVVSSILSLLSAADQCPVFDKAYLGRFAGLSASDAISACRWLIRCDLRASSLDALQDGVRSRLQNFQHRLL